MKAHVWMYYILNYVHSIGIMFILAYLSGSVTQCAFYMCIYIVCVCVYIVCMCVYILCVYVCVYIYILCVYIYIVCIYFVYVCVYIIPGMSLGSWYVCVCVCVCAVSTSGTLIIIHSKGMVKPVLQLFNIALAKCVTGKR